MQQPDKRPWYKKKRYIGILGVTAVLVLGSASADTTPTPAPTYVPSQAQPAQLSNDNYYTNVSGNQVHSPAFSNTVPTGASAECRDGTYSFSQHRSGTCSHHGGVAEWL